MANQALPTDELIDELDRVIADGESCTFHPSEQIPFLTCEVHLQSSGYISPRDRQPKSAQLTLLAEGLAMVVSRTNLLRGQELAIHTTLAQTPEGERLCKAEGSVANCRRVSGSYEVDIELERLTLEHHPVAELLNDCIVQGNFAGWNRWCTHLVDGPILRELDLSGAMLTNFDLCCADLSFSNLTGADLSGCNLSGANLTGCILDGVRVTGADLFAVRLPRRYTELLTAAGLVEVESVRWTNSSDSESPAS